MIDKLPYQLTAGVTATREGLQFRSPLMVTVEYFPYDIANLEEPLTIPWPDAAKRLLILTEVNRAAVVDEDRIVCTSRMIPRVARKAKALHRLAAILCDDAEGFRVL